MSLYQFQNPDDTIDPVFFGNHHDVMEEGAWDVPIQVYSVPGVIGTAHLIDEPKGRPLTCYLRYQGFSDYATLVQGLRNLDAVVGKVTGAVYFTGALEGAYWNNCTFLGYERGNPRWNPAYSEWWVEGKLHWLQRSQ